MVLYKMVMKAGLAARRESIVIILSMVFISSYHTHLTPNAVGGISNLEAAPQSEWLDK
jgi:hypothetical protein